MGTGLLAVRNSIGNGRTYYVVNKEFIYSGNKNRFSYSK